MNKISDIQKFLELVVTGKLAPKAHIDVIDVDAEKNAVTATVIALAKAG